MNKKSQAAMEFLMTYGWAILIVLIAVGALWYFGVLNPEGLEKLYGIDRCKCDYNNLTFSAAIEEDNIKYIECSETEYFLNDDKTRIESQITYTIFYCDEDLKQLIEVE